jgi:hypothetical protein
MARAPINTAKNVAKDDHCAVGGVPRTYASAQPITTPTAPAPACAIRHAFGNGSKPLFSGEIMSEFNPQCFGCRTDLRLPGNNSICLALMVQNEAHVLERCITPFLPIIDRAVAVISEATNDGSQAVIERVLGDIPRAIYVRPGHVWDARRESLQAGHASGSEYTCVIDCDDTLILPRPYMLGRLRADAYNIYYRAGTIDYPRRFLLSNSHEWRAVGETHDHIVSDTARHIERLPRSIYVQKGKDGATYKDPEKYVRDAERLKAKLDAMAQGTARLGIVLRSPEYARTIYYYAQSLRDAGDYRRAYMAYDWRAGLPGQWEEESWHAGYEAAKAYELFNPLDDIGIVGRYWTSHMRRPYRIEPVFELARRAYHARQWPALLELTWLGMAIREEQARNDVLFVDRAMLEWRLLDLHTIALWHARRATEASLLLDDLLRSDVEWLDEENARRLANNRKLFADANSLEAYNPLMPSWCKAIARRRTREEGYPGATGPEHTAELTPDIADALCLDPNRK